MPAENPGSPSQRSIDDVEEVLDRDIADERFTDALEDTLPLVAAGLIAAFIARRSLRPNPISLHDSAFRGQQRIEEWLRRHNSGMHSHLGVSPSVFRRLQADLEAHSTLSRTRYVSVEERLGMFLYIVRGGMSVRHTAETFQRSYDTVHQAFHAVLDAMTEKDYYNRWIHMLTDRDQPAARLLQDRRFNPFFEDCIGAVDGTHINVKVSEEDRGRYRTRKGELAMNVLAVCTFDLRFCYVLAGWEGSAHDNRVFKDAAYQDLRIPPGKYLLGDAAFIGCNGCLTPFAGIRYHLKEWSRSGDRPMTPQELWNLRHAGARNVIERIFGVMKARYKIIEDGSNYSIKDQARIVLAVCVLFNAVRHWEASEDLEGPLVASDAQVFNGNVPYEADNGDAEQDDEGDGDDDFQQRPQQVRADRCNLKRQEIMEDMWESYQTYLQQRGRGG